MVSRRNKLLLATCALAVFALAVGSRLGEQMREPTTMLYLLGGLVAFYAVLHYGQDTGRHED